MRNLLACHQDVFTSRQFSTTAARGNPFGYLEILAARYSGAVAQSKLCLGTFHGLNLPGWRWARIKQLALVGSSSSLHSEVCKALRGSFGVVYSKISVPEMCVRAVSTTKD